LLRAVEPIRSVNGYGLFRVMTTERPEIVIEGSRDGVEWSEYGFRWKPGDVHRRPAFVAPYMPRLDWQMWFAALNPEGAREWLPSLLRHVLTGTPEVLALLGDDPFPDAAPCYVRLAYFRYRFSTPRERAASGAWWPSRTAPPATCGRSCRCASVTWSPGTPSIRASPPPTSWTRRRSRPRNSKSCTAITAACT